MALPDQDNIDDFKVSLLRRYLLDDGGIGLLPPTMPDHPPTVSLYYDHPTQGIQEINEFNLNQSYTRKTFVGEFSVVGNTVSLANTESITWVNSDNTAWPVPVKAALHVVINGTDPSFNINTDGIALLEVDFTGRGVSVAPGEILSIGRGQLKVELT